jgi:hypothetical protein
MLLSREPSRAEDSDFNSLQASRFASRSTSDPPAGRAPLPGPRGAARAVPSRAEFGFFALHLLQEFGDGPVGERVGRKEGAGPKLANHARGLPSPYAGVIQLQSELRCHDRLSGASCPKRLSGVHSSQPPLTSRATASSTAPSHAWRRALVAVGFSLGFEVRARTQESPLPLHSDEASHRGARSSRQRSKRDRRSGSASERHCWPTP